MNEERQWQQQEQKEEDNPHGDPPTRGTTSGLSLLAAWRSAQAGQQRLLTHFPIDPGFENRGGP